MSESSSSELLAERLEALRSRYSHCFACGRDNPMGLHLDHFDRVEDEVFVPFTPRPEYAGFTGVLHGGIVATALDEILAWSAMLLEGVFVFTGTLDLRYKRPAAVDESYRLVGQVDERRGRRLRLSGRLEDSGGAVALASGLYIVNEDGWS